MFSRTLGILYYVLLTRDGVSWLMFLWTDDPEEIGGYDEASIRYLGRKIPSKSFQLLQSMTGGPAPDGIPLICTHGKLPKYFTIQVPHGHYHHPGA